MEIPGIGQAVVDGIISSKLFHAYCPDDPAAPVLVVWSSAASEQIEAIISTHLVQTQKPNPS